MVIIIPHTHWDREWYLPFESYRQWLVTVIDKAIDALGSGELEKFTLDGQSVVVEDYLEVRPENEKKFADLVKRKKLKDRAVVHPARRVDTQRRGAGQEPTLR